jgi:hypothetical protein
METTSTIISALVAIVSSIVAISSVVKSFIRVNKSPHITLTNKDHRTITIAKRYNKTDSRALIEFMK